jgi:hypothetical protein
VRRGGTGSAAIINRRSRLVISVLAVLPSIPLLGAAPSAAVTAAPVVVDLPSEVRAAPRYLDIIGRTDDGHLVVLRDEDPGQADGLARFLVAPDGSEVGLDSPVDDVVGNRLVQSFDQTAPAVTSQLVGTDSWDSVTVPAGGTYLGYTSDGVLQKTGDPGSEQVSLLPWNGDAPITIDGLAPGVSPYASYRRIGDDGLTFLWNGSSTQGDDLAVVVDSESQRAWTLDSGTGDCQLANASLLTLAGRTLAWAVTVDTGRVICTLTIPTAADAVVEPATARPANFLAGLPSSIGYELLPVGDQVLVAPWGAQTSQWGTSTNLAIRAVGPDGTVRVLAVAGCHLTSADAGHVVAVTGSEPGRESITDRDVASGEFTEVLSVEPVNASYAGIAIDGTTVAYADNSSHLGALRERTLDFAGGGASSSTLVDSDVVGDVAAGGGALAWGKSGWAGLWSGHLASDGTVTHSHQTDVLQTDDRWVLTDRGGWWDSSAPDASQYPWKYDTSRALLDGVVYAPGHAVPGGPADRVLAFDAATRRAAAIAVPGCVYLGSVQVAGSWMLVSCNLATGGGATIVVDRTGVTPPWQTDFQPTPNLYLGNGFLVSRGGDGALSWTALASSAHEWQPLGAVAGPNSWVTDYKVAVSRDGDVPSVAWYDANSVGHVALLPVSGTQLPPHVGGILAPSEPQVSARGVSTMLYVNWNSAPQAEQVTQYSYAASALNPFTPHRSAAGTRPGDATDLAITQLDNGVAYDVTVKAWNIAGSAVSAPARGTPLPPPAQPSDVHVTVDDVLSTATITWSWTAVPGTDDLKSFTIMAGGGPLLMNVPASARSAHVVMDQPWEGDLKVAAEGPWQESISAGVPASFPGRDLTAPTASLRGIPRVSWTGVLSPRIVASDDRRLSARPVDVRWRSAAFGKRLGPWLRPVAWQGRQPGQFSVPKLARGQTACFSTRAHDAAGNHSAWTPAVCTGVPIDDRVLRSTGPVTRLTGARFFGGSATRLDSAEAMLQLDGVNAAGGWLIASTCPDCGRVQVVIGFVSYGSVNLHSDSVRDRRVLTLAGSGGIERGRLDLSPGRTGGRVVIDAVVLIAH